jgi:hypothetical protein
MLVFRPRALIVVPLGGLSLLAVLVLGFVAQLRTGEYALWAVCLPFGLIGALVSSHVLRRWMWVGVRGEQLRWRGLGRRGAAPRVSCRLHGRVTAAGGRTGGSVAAVLMADEREGVELAVFPHDARAEAKLQRIAERLDLGLSMDG